MGSEQSGEATEQGGLEFTWRNVALAAIGYVLSYAVFEIFLPELPAVWVAVIVAALFALFVVGLPLGLARLRKKSTADLT